MNMSYGKEDFINFDDLDLEALLGEFTASENEVSDDELCDNGIDMSNKPTPKLSKPTKSKIYFCDQCENSYVSISGIRGHMSSKHDKRNIKASEYKKDAAGKKKLADIQEDSEQERSKLENAFTTAYKQSLKNLQEDPMYNIFGVSTEARCAKISDGNSNIEEYFKKVMVKCFDNEKVSSVCGRELFFKKFHSVRTDQCLLNEGIETLESNGLNCVSNADKKNFIQILLLDLIGEIIKTRNKMEKKESEKNHADLDDNDNKILFYISGYIINSMEKLYTKLKNKEKSKIKLKRISGLRSRTSETTFTKKFSTWYEKKKRGGLKKTCDDFFCLVREFENVVRKNVNEKKLSCDSLLKSELKEKILDAYMVKHYEEKLFPTDGMDDEIYDTYVEDALNLFLTIRGFAVAKSVKKKVKIDQKKEKVKSSESLRGALKCISNK